MARYKGNDIERIEFDRRRSVYLLYDGEDTRVAELSAAAFLSQPQLRKVHHGRHRRADQAAQGHSAYASGGTYARASLTIIPVGFSGTTWFTLDQPERKPIENAGIRAGEIVAWRAWRVIGERLHSVFLQTHCWQPGQPMRGAVSAISEGVHAFKQRELAQYYVALKQATEDRLDNMFRRFCGLLPEQHSYVVGAVDLWGDVIEHEHGYRAEFAQVKSLDEVIGTPIDLDLLRRTYRVKE